VVVGTPTANRGRAEIENLIGFFVNTLALRLDLSSSPTVSELLEQAKTQALAAQQHQDIPFEQVVELAKPVRSLAHSPLFQVMFAWQNASEGSLELPGLQLEPLAPSPHRVAKFDLTLLLQEAGQSIVGGIEYATSLFERATIERYLGYFRNLLEAMAAGDNQAVDRLPMLSQSERHRVLYEWNDTAFHSPIRPSSAEPAVLIKVGHAKRPLFLPHCDAGELDYLQTLAPYIDDAIPIYGLPSIHPGRAQLQTVEGMATRMLQMIRFVQPTGPYRVAGWSFGGMLAYEIATQLIGLDQDVEFLGLIDTYYPIGLLGSSNHDEILLNSNQQLFPLTNHKDSRSNDSQPASEEHGLDLRAMTSELHLQIAHEAKIVRPSLRGLTTAQIQSWLDRSKIFHRACRLYFAQPLPIPLTLFAAQNKHNPNATLGWNAVVPEEQLRIIPTTGNHQSAVEEPNVRTLGKILSSFCAHNSRTLPQHNCNPLFTLRAGTNKKTPLFCIPGAGDNVTSLLDFSSCLHESWPVHALQPRGLDGLLVPHSTVSAASDFYLRAINEAYPNGPIGLLGHSFGGWVAFDIALRLLDAGRAVASLIILDADAPHCNTVNDCEYTHVDVFLELVHAFERILDSSLNIKESDVDPQDPGGNLDLLHEQLVIAGIMPRRSEPDVLRGLLRTFATALRTPYRPHKPYPGRMQLVLADDERLDEHANREEHVQTLAEWQRWAPHLLCSHCLGNHMTMLKMPHVRGLAQSLNFT
jgi:thioesterase domain-containing protein